MQCSSHCTISPTHIDDATKLTFALASRIGEAIRPHRLTQAAAAQRFFIDQPKPSRPRHFYLTNFSPGRLMPVLTLLARDVELATKPTPAPAAPPASASSRPPNPRRPHPVPVFKEGQGSALDPLGPQAPDPILLFRDWHQFQAILLELELSR
jgi:hypothetical protein